MASSANKVRWGDTLDEDDSLPSNSVVGPDKQGIQTITEYKKNDKGETVKVVTKVKISKVERKIYAVRSADLWPNTGCQYFPSVLQAPEAALLKGRCNIRGQALNPLCWSESRWQQNGRGA